jgi:hypothetical protein
MRPCPAGGSRRRARGVWYASRPPRVPGGTRAFRQAAASFSFVFANSTKVFTSRERNFSFG